MLDQRVLLGCQHIQLLVLLKLLLEQVVSIAAANLSNLLRLRHLYVCAGFGLLLGAEAMTHAAHSGPCHAELGLLDSLGIQQR